MSDVWEGCKLYEPFRAEFCPWAYGTIAEPHIAAAYRQGVDITTPSGKTYKAQPFVSENNTIDFLVTETGKEDYIITNANYWYYNTFNNNEPVAKALKGLYLFDELIALGNKNTSTIQNLLQNSATLSATAEKLTINYTTTPVLSDALTGIVIAVPKCMYEQATTVKRYINNIGYNPNNSAYVYVVEDALEDCNFDCYACADPICVFNKIRETILPENTTDINLLHTAFLHYGIALSQTEISNFMPHFATIAADVYATSITNRDYVLCSTRSIAADNELVWERFEDLHAAITANPYALLNSCIEADANINIADYAALYNFTIPASTQTRLNTLGFTNQPIEQGNAATTNLDYYSVEITTMPDINGDLFPDSYNQVADAFRLNFPALASGTALNFQFDCPGPVSQDNIFWEFLPYSGTEYTKWQSTNNYLNTVFKIDAGGDAIFTSLLADLGAVIVSQRTPQCCWQFSTINTPLTGTQPFLGNRQFGSFINANGKTVIYTKAVDTALTENMASIAGYLFNECDDDTYYAIANATWTNLQQEVISFVVQHGGAAHVERTDKIRVDVDILRSQLKSTTPVNFAPCQH